MGNGIAISILILTFAAIFFLIGTVTRFANGCSTARGKAIAVLSISLPVVAVVLTLSYLIAADIGLVPGARIEFENGGSWQIGTVGE